MRILVTGSRVWADRAAIRSALLEAAEGFRPGNVTVVHGAARGADTLAGEVARELGMRVEAHPAEWRRHGKSAGHIRNAEMVNLGADLVLAFPLDLSKGTRGCIELAAKAGLLVRNLGDPDPAEQPDLFGAAS